MVSNVLFDFFEAMEPYERLEECVDEECDGKDCRHEKLVWQVVCE